MSELWQKADTAKLLQKAAESLRSLADSIQAVCAIYDGSPQEPPVTKQQTVPLEKVRGVLAEKSRDGFTAEVREIMQSFGAERLSEIDPAQYEAVLKKAEVLGNG